MLSIDSPEISTIKIPNYNEEGDCSVYYRLTNYSPKAIYFKNQPYDVRPREGDMYINFWIKRRAVLIL